MSETRYQYTGKSHPVDKNQLIRSVYDAIDEFEADRNKLNPFEEAVVVKLPDGKIIQVPSEIQNEALGKWATQNGKEMTVRQNNGQPNNVENNGPPNNVEESPYHNDRRTPIPSKKNDNYGDMCNGSFLKYIILILMIMLTLYILTKK